jgi:hypothetical protein
MELLNSIKDSFTSFLGEKYLFSQLEKYGKMHNFKIDSKNKKINLNITLKGEKEPLEINIDKYEIINKNSSDYFKISEISTTKKWMNILAEDFIKEKEIIIPKKYSYILKFFV